MQKHITNLFIASAVSVLLAGSFIATKCLQPVFHPYALTAVRLLFSTLFLMPIFIIKGGSAIRTITRYDLLMLFGVGFFGTFLNNHLFTLALRSAPPTTIAIINATLPLMVLLAVAFLYRTVPSLLTVAAFICSFCGIILVLGKSDFSRSMSFESGELFMIFSNCAGVVQALFLQRVGKKFNSYVLTFISSIIGLAFLIPLGMHHEMVNVTLHMQSHEWLALLILAIACTALPNVGFAYSIVSLGASTATFFIMGLVPLFVSLLSFIFFGEGLTGTQVLGGFLVIASLSLVMQQETQKGYG